MVYVMLRGSVKARFGVKVLKLFGGGVTSVVGGKKGL